MDVLKCCDIVGLFPCQTFLCLTKNVFTVPLQALLQSFKSVSASNTWVSTVDGQLLRSINKVLTTHIYKGNYVLFQTGKDCINLNCYILFAVHKRILLHKTSLHIYVCV